MSKYVELVKRIEELTTELNQLQRERVEAAQNKEGIQVSESISDKLSVCIDTADPGEDRLIVLVSEVEDVALGLTVEEFNRIGMFLQKYNDAIYCYMNRDKEEVAQEVTE